MKLKSKLSSYGEESTFLTDILNVTILKVKEIVDNEYNLFNAQYLKFIL